MKKQFIFATAALLICFIQKNLAAQTASEQEIALESGMQELGQPKRETLYTDRTKAVVLAAADTDYYSPQTVSDMRISLSDENMARLRANFTSRQTGTAQKVK